MTTRIKTEAVRDTLIGQARKAFDEAAGAPHKNGAKVISKAEQEKLPADLQKAIENVRKEKRIVTVEDAVSAYARHVSRVLGAVDKGGKGLLSIKETARIGDEALRGRVVDIRAQLAGGGGVGGPGAVNRGKLDQNIEDLQEEWGSANIMDGVVGLAGTVVAGDAKGTAVRDLDALKGDGTVDEFVGARVVDGPRKVSDADIKKLAEALNDDGFQYAQRDAVPDLKKQIASLLKSLGGPAGLDVAVAKQNALPSHIDFGNDRTGVPAQVWTFTNGKTGDAVSVTVIKGTL